MSSVSSPNESSISRKVSPERPPSAEHVVVCGVIGPTHMGDISPCPCCNRRISHEEEVRQTLDEPAPGARREDIPCLFNCSDDHEDEEYGSEEAEVDYLPGVLDSGVEYKFKRVLAEGWLNKKGSGRDWMRSRAQKPRWARLVLAKVDGFGDVDVPLLQIYWFRESATPSTVLLLDSTVVVPVDKDETQTCNPYRFNIVHAKNDNVVTRTFSAPKKARNEWVYCINSALLKYEKDCAQARREAAALADLRPVHSSSFDSVLEGERFRTVSESTCRPVSPPPLSPRPPLASKRPLPRPDQLLGESLLGLNTVRSTLLE